MTDEKKKVMVAMSGGVDSSVTAYLLQQEGFDIVGVTMKLYTNDDIDFVKDKTCCSLDDVEDAKSVAARLGALHYTLNMTEDFRKDVMDKFVRSYRLGATPNPCIDCNRYIKFSKLLKKAIELKMDLIATGHYARIEKSADRYLLKKALDESKDQSYVLYSLTQDQLSRIIFPLGRMTKHEAREIAEAQGFVNADKHDSQDICFVPDGDYAHYIENWCGFRFTEGDFVDRDGNFIAKHKGIINYTIGQRKGLGIAAKAPYYVVSKDLAKNQVILGSNDDLFSNHLEATDLNFISIEKLTEPMKVKAKVRYRQKETDAVITPLENGNVSVDFETPQRAIAPGQAVVFYDGDIVVGGGTII